jgi:hypothetical protein
VGSSDDEMAMFTILMEYKGGTYLSQVESGDVREAVEKWATSFNYEAVEGMTASSKEVVLEDIMHEDPASVSGLTNTWACCIQIENDVALLHIIRTEATG